MTETSTSLRHRSRVSTCTSLAAAVLLAGCAAAATAAEPGSGGGAAPTVIGQSELERALAAPKASSGVRTRGLRIAPRTEVPTPVEGQGVAGGAPAAGVAPASPGSPVAAASGDEAGSGSGSGSASIALDIPFELNSSALRPAAAAQLRQLAAALKSESLQPFRFLIAGHTDASGDAGYNRRLSGRRADTVRRRLIDAGVDPKRLDARGFGEDELLDPKNPGAAANRRVEIRNLGSAQP